MDEGFLTRTNNTRRGIKLPPITPIADMGGNQVVPKDANLLGHNLMNESAISKCNNSSLMKADDFKIETVEISQTLIIEPEEPEIEDKSCFGRVKGCFNKFDKVMSRLQFFKYAVGELEKHEPKQIDLGIVGMIKKKTK